MEVITVTFEQELSSTQRIEETKLETQGKEQYNKHTSCQVMKNKLEQRHSLRSLYFEVILLPSEEQELSSVLEQPD